MLLRESKEIISNEKGERMDRMRSLVNDDKFSLLNAGQDLMPVTCRDYFIMSHKKVNYYLIDLREVHWDSLWAVIGECEYVESACWTPQENFSDYLKRCDYLCYAELDGCIIGFTAVSMMFFRKVCLWSNDETMVLKEHRNKKIALNLVMLPLEWVFVRTRRFRDAGHIVFTSISANPRVVNSYFKNSWTRIFFDCSFQPSLQLIAIKNEYCRKYKISLVHDDYPFCMKNLFPGSNTFKKDDPKFQFSPQVKASMPLEFDHMTRGDAFAFMLKVPMKPARAVTRILMFRCFGRDYLTSREVGPFSAERRGASPAPGRHQDKSFAVVTQKSIATPQNNSSQAETLTAGFPRNGSAASQERE
jgi:hypothetical protein